MTPAGVLVAGIVLIVLGLAIILWPDDRNNRPPEE